MIGQQSSYVRSPMPTSVPTKRLADGFETSKKTRVTIQGEGGPTKPVRCT